MAPPKKQTFASKKQARVDAEASVADAHNVELLEASRLSLVALHRKMGKKSTTESSEMLRDSALALLKEIRMSGVPLGHALSVSLTRAAIMIARDCQQGMGFS